MHGFLRFFQFVPIALFLYFSKRKGWELGFEIGGAAATVQMALFLFLKIPVSRILAGANLFLIVGALSFFFRIEPALATLSALMETAIFVCILIVFVLATVFTKTGVFEIQSTDAKNVRIFSLLMIAVAIACGVWSYYQRGNVGLAGTAPFIMLILMKTILQNRLKS